MKKIIVNTEFVFFLAVALANFNLTGQEGDGEASELKSAKCYSSQSRKNLVNRAKVFFALKDIPKSYLNSNR